jgi:hypothetical protein
MNKTILLLEGGQWSWQTSEQVGLVQEQIMQASLAAVIHLEDKEASKMPVASQ